MVIQPWLYMGWPASLFQAVRSRDWGRFCQPRQGISIDETFMNTAGDAILPIHTWQRKRLP